VNSDKSVRGLYVIADTGIITKDLVQAVTEAIEGGASVVQYRDKSDNTAKRSSDAIALRDLCRQHDVTFIINDDAELARQVKADGVHLGKNDADIASARELLGTHAIVGISCYNELERGRSAITVGASYIAFGSFYPSTVKPNAVHASDALLTQAQQEFTVPIVAIGGITPENGARLVAAGADALAVITGIFKSGDIRGAARQYAKLFSNQI